jgi:general secretion pathway protein G
MEGNDMKTRRKLRQELRRGFTLLEVLLVLVILGVIAALVVPRLLGVQQGSYKDATKASIAGLEAALDIYTVKHDGYPESLDDLLEPVDRDGNNMQPYLKEFPRDGWGERFNYKVEIDEDMAGAQVARIWSNGPDRKDDDGDGDDVNNWSTSDDDR